MSAVDPQGAEITLGDAFQLESAEVVVEAFPDETIAVHLGTGRYYSLDLMGAETFELLVSGRDLGAVVQHLGARYRAEPALVESTITDFVSQLVDERLISRAPGAGPDVTFAAPSPGETAFTAPSLAVYSDMEDLLLLDPIHDVDDTGWPVRADAADLAPVESREE